MKADSLRISKVFSSGGDVHYYLPYFQREYAWEKSNWQTLLDDVFGLYEIYNEEKPPEHFMGSLVVINDGTRNGTIPAFKLVDGQQRLTSISLLLAVLASLTKESLPILYTKIRKMILNQDEMGDLRYKLLPTKKYGDQDAFKAIVDEEELPVRESKILEAYQFFHQEINRNIQLNKIDPQKFYLVLVNSLQVVFIDLNHDERPYEIFESLNAKGKPLTQADLVRNYIAMRLPEKRQPEIFDKYWSKVEEKLQEKRVVGRSRLGELTAFLRHYISFQTGALCNESHVYERFRDRIESDFSEPNTFESEIKQLKIFSEYYDRFLRPENESENEIKVQLERLSILEYSTSYPFLLGVFDAYNKGSLSKTSLISGLKILENYFVRRYLTGEPTNYLNKLFPNLEKDINYNDFEFSLKTALLSKKYPSDHQIRISLITEGLYDKSLPTRMKTSLILDSINRYLSVKKSSGAYTVLSGDPTIEHIMPQTLNDLWKEMLGENFDQIYRDYLHTLGNLTIVTADWNASLSNSGFFTKKEKLSNHGILLNSEYFKKQVSTWNEDEIRKRADFLGNLILEIWPALGEQPEIKTSIGTKPVAINILGQRIIVRSWRDVACQTSEEMIKLNDNFDEIAEMMPAYLERKKFPRASRQLSNGWFINTNLSAQSIKTYCRNLIAAFNLDDSDWSVEEK